MTKLEYRGGQPEGGADKLSRSCSSAFAVVAALAVIGFCTLGYGAIKYFEQNAHHPIYVQ